MIRDDEVLQYPQVMVGSSITACKWPVYTWHWHKTLSCINEWILVTDSVK